MKIKIKNFPKKKLSIILIGLIILTGGIFLIRQFLVRADLSQQVYISPNSDNLLANPGFEEKIGDWPVHWENQNDTGGLKQLVADEKHSGSYSWKFTQNSVSSFQSAVSSLIPVTRYPYNYYQLSFWAKSKNGTEKISAGWEEFDQNFNKIKTNSFVIGDTSIDKEWRQYTNITQPEAKYVRVRIVGPHKTIGEVWWDDFVLTKLSKKPETVFGCKNDSNAKCLDLGNSSTENNTTFFDLRQNKEVGIDQIFTERSIEDSIDFRQIKPKSRFELTFPAFSVGAEGFPQNDLLLEIRYKDVIDDSIGIVDPNSVRRKHRAFVYSKVNYKNLDYFIVGSLGDNKTNQWVYEQVLLAETDFQQLRAIDGKYVFKIEMPALVAEDNSLNLPIDYIALHSLSSGQADQFKKWQRDVRMLQEINYVENNTLPNFSEDFTWFSTSTMKMVFTNQVPLASEIKKPIKLISPLSETEPFTFSVYTKKDIENVSFEISDLASSANKITQEKIILRKVVSDLKYWKNAYWPKAYYGLIPERLEKFATIALKANTSQQFWGEIKIDKNTPPGQYEGTISLKISGAEKASIPISIEVMPFALDAPTKSLIVYRSLKYFDADKVATDMVEHDAETVNALTGYSIQKKDNQLIFDTSAFEETLQKSKDKGLIGKKAFYTYMENAAGSIISALGLNNLNLWQRLTHPDFENAFKKLLSQLKSIAQKYDVELVLSPVDEPGRDKNKRIIADRLSRLALSEGIKTWVTYYDTCRQEIPCEECGGNLPSLADLITYKVYAKESINDANINLDKNNFGYYTTGISQIRNPICNRFFNSLLAEKTGAQVVANWSYWGEVPGDTYNEFDWEPEYEFPFSYPDFLMAYPTWSGEIIPTIAWEGLREGVKDAKYIATLKKLIQQDPLNETANEAQQYLNSLLAKIPQNWTNDYATKGNQYGFANQILKYISDNSQEDDYAAFDNIRQKLIDYIKALKPPAKENLLTIKLQGRSNNLSANNAVLKVFDTQDPTRLIMEKSNLSFNSDGKTSIIFDNIIIGQSYNFQIKTPYYLSAMFKNIVYTDTLTLDFPALLGGDLDNNNMVNSLDFAILNSKFGQSDPIADIDQNGKVNSLDFAILNANFAKRGQ